jgi:hypothetical protein
MSFAGRRNENDRYRMVAEHGNGLCAGRMGMDYARGGGNQKGRTQNEQNREWPTTIAALISSKDLPLQNHIVIYLIQRTMKKLS